LVAGLVDVLDVSLHFVVSPLQHQRRSAADPIAAMYHRCGDCRCQRKPDYFGIRARKKLGCTPAEMEMHLQ
jgi:hypothetical protein